ncbi:MAG: hypothetical protein KJ069_29580 [Anaerolineae bacterium]|nr:hypothetical protein [Anaerolineae bacterium]
MNTNGSVTLSPNEINDIKQLLTDFVEGKVSIRQIQKGLHGYLFLNFDNAPDSREIGHGSDLDLSKVIRVRIGTRHLCHMLQSYIAGQITELDLSNWAAFVFMSELFVSEEGYEPIQELVWDIIQELMTPKIFGGLNESVAQQYLESLYDSDGTESLL